MNSKLTNNLFTLFGLLAASGASLLSGEAMADVIFSESFEAGAANYSLTGGFGAGGTTDYFEVIPNNGSRVDAATITTGGVFSGDDGDFVLASDDSNAAGTSPVRITFNSVNTSGYTGLSLNLLLAASNPTQGSATRGFESTDELEIEIDTGGGFQQLVIFQEDDSFNSGTNSYLSLDTNIDGNGDGNSGNAPSSIEQGFKEFVFPFNSATSAQIRINIKGEATGEYIAIDNVRVLGAVVPEPSAFLLLISGIVGSANWFRRDRQRRPTSI